MAVGRSAPSGRNISPAALIEARRLYEDTNVPVESIAVLLGVHKTTVYRHARHKMWRPRRLDAPVSPPAWPPIWPPAPVAPAADVPPIGASDVEASQEPVTDARSRCALIARLVRRIEQEIAAIERLVAKAGRERETDGVAETERAARTLSILVRSLRELAALENNQPGEDDDAAERDAGAYRRELEATLERVLAGGAAA